MSNHTYKYIHTHSISMSTSKRLGQLDFKIHEIDQRASYYRRRRHLSLKIISRKYVILTLNLKFESE
jgi:chromatin remodeling complex protein RSC6